MGTLQHRFIIDIKSWDPYVETPNESMNKTLLEEKVLDLRPANPCLWPIAYYAMSSGSVTS